MGKDSPGANPLMPKGTLKCRSSMTTGWCRVGLQDLSLAGQATRCSSSLMQKSRGSTVMGHTQRIQTIQKGTMMKEMNPPEPPSGREGGWSERSTGPEGMHAGSPWRC